MSVGRGKRQRDKKDGNEPVKKIQKRTSNSNNDYSKFPTLYLNFLRTQKRKRNHPPRNEITNQPRLSHLSWALSLSHTLIPFEILLFLTFLLRSLFILVPSVFHYSCYYLAFMVALSIKNNRVFKLTTFYALCLHKLV
jgi:hypothetical protein